MRRSYGGRLFELDELIESEFVSSGNFSFQHIESIDDDHLQYAVSEIRSEHSSVIFYVLSSPFGEKVESFSHASEG